MAVANQKGWYLDLNRCTGCKACAIACKAENNTHIKVNFRWVMTILGGTYPNPIRFWVSMACNHCAEPACLKACPVASTDNPGDTTTGNLNKNAIVKRGLNGDMDKDDGIVYIDDQYCIGCKRCVAACPYGAPNWNPETGNVEKCHMCFHRQDNVVDTVPTPLAPSCVTTCVGKALKFGDLATIDTDNPTADTDMNGFAKSDLTNPSIRFKKIDGIN